MKKGDFIWLAALAAVVAFLLVPTTHDVFNDLTASHPYIMGFIKFAVLATMGELMALRIVTGNYKKPAGLIWRMIIWGFIGMLITLMFNVFAGGVIAAQSKGFLPFDGNNFAFAFFTSTIMNLFFAPAFMGFHKYTDTLLDLKAERKGKVTVTDITNAIDWNGFVSFVLMKTIPFFWIPAHTITFLLPPEYRVIAAAFLSIALGAILAFAKRKK
ncbi:MAG: Mpv17/PMP22 family protein [Clostridia bacterium]|nr:Mpv17/PMP22 family protein [Clostridia bacterium]